MEQDSENKPFEARHIGYFFTVLLSGGALAEKGSLQTPLVPLAVDAGLLLAWACFWRYSMKLGSRDVRGRVHTLAAVMLGVSVPNIVLHEQVSMPGATSLTTDCIWVAIAIPSFGIARFLPWVVRKPAEALGMGLTAVRWVSVGVAVIALAVAFFWITGEIYAALTVKGLLIIIVVLLLLR